MVQCFGINTPHYTKAADTCSRRNIYCISRRPPVPDGGHARTHARNRLDTHMAQYLCKRRMSLCLFGLYVMVVRQLQ